MYGLPDDLENVLVAQPAEPHGMQLRSSGLSPPRSAIEAARLASPCLPHDAAPPDSPTAHSEIIGMQPEATGSRAPPSLAAQVHPHGQGPQDGPACLYLYAPPRLSGSASRICSTSCTPASKKYSSSSTTHAVPGRTWGHRLAVAAAADHHPVPITRALRAVRPRDGPHLQGGDFHPRYSVEGEGGCKRGRERRTLPCFFFSRSSTRFVPRPVSFCRASTRNCPHLRRGSPDRWFVGGLRFMKSFGPPPRPPDRPEVPPNTGAIRWRVEEVKTLLPNGRGCFAPAVVIRQCLAPQARKAPPRA